MQRWRDMTPPLPDEAEPVRAAVFATILLHVKPADRSREVIDAAYAETHDIAGEYSDAKWRVRVR